MAEEAKGTGTAVDRDEALRERAADIIHEVMMVFERDFGKTLFFSLTERAEVHHTFGGSFVSINLWVPEE